MRESSSESRKGPVTYLNQVIVKLKKGETLIAFASCTIPTEKPFIMMQCPKRSHIKRDTKSKIIKLCVLREAVFSFCFLAWTKQTRHQRKRKRTVKEDKILIISNKANKTSDCDKRSSPLFVANIYSIKTFSIPVTINIVSIAILVTFRIDSFLANIL